jgi:CheY-like chemotaxis protein
MMAFQKILLVDDDPEDRAIISDALVDLRDDVDIAIANNGEQALDLLHHDVTAGTLPCLVVLDLNMPKMGGAETLQHLKSSETLKHIPVIIYSTSINPFEQQRCMALGAHSYITKPVSYRESMDTARLFFAFCTSPHANVVK